MNTDGTNVQPITNGEPVDWFPRFSPDGSRILFTRSKKGWVFERDANTDGKWDIYTVTPDGKDETKIVDNASWGTWVSNDEIVYARATAIVRRKLGTKRRPWSSTARRCPSSTARSCSSPRCRRTASISPSPCAARSGRRGSGTCARRPGPAPARAARSTGARSAGEVYWVHPTGNGGSRVLHIPIKDGKAAKSDEDIDALTLIDIPGRRSHEYFPQLSADGHWLVWAATQRGHDHDIADYEIYLWQVGTPPEKAARLTWHSGNDRWPDIFVPGGAS